ncbi:hypothetical protein JXA56_03060 [Candidatus Micrarchaeota archaeon]|nr:hypothetical protein [Candidatus Micrarchaeota archaeon]
MRGRILKFAAVGLLAAGCSKKEPDKFRCYDYKDQTLRVSLGDMEYPMKIVEEDPLDYFCTYSGHLFWLTNNHLHVKKLSIKGTAVEAEELFKDKHTRPDEYNVPGVSILSGDIWDNPGTEWENITIATITNTGMFQAIRYSLPDIANNTPDRATKELSLLSEKNRWSSVVADAVVKIIGEELFVVISTGKKGEAEVKKFYNISFEGPKGSRFSERMMAVTPKELWMLYPDLHNIAEISSPIRYDSGLGGWVVNLAGENQNGELFPMFPIVAD